MHQPSEIKIAHPTPRFADLDLEAAFISSKDTYNRRLAWLKKQILQVQQAYYHHQRRAIIVLEGWDASGKGGSIRKITEKLDPRGFAVHPIAAPRPEEQGRHYLYRFQTRLPRPGRFAIFDRSWYGRVLVERVEGFATEQEWQRAYQEINEFERMLTDDGVTIVKLFLHISKEEQVKRFRARMENPLKRWKLSLEDVRNHQKWDQYLEAAEMMFEQTSTLHAPWQLIPAEHKWFARLQVMETIVRMLGEDVDLAPPELDPDVARAIENEFGLSL